MILGLTGAFGGGKSTVLKYFHNCSWYTFDADAECHKLYAANAPELCSAVKEIFGSGAFDSANRIDKREIARQGFEAPEKMKALTDVLYPLLNSVMAQQIQMCRSKNISGIFELPLLYEAGYKKYFDAVVAIWTDPEIRCQRLKNRNFSREDMLRRDARQLDPVLKLENADFALVNNGTPEMLQLQLQELLRQL